jgi:hypothetical protein
MSCHLVNLQSQLGIHLNDLPPVAAGTVDRLLAAVLCSRAVLRLDRPGGLARYRLMASANHCHSAKRRDSRSPLEAFPDGAPPI